MLVDLDMGGLAASSALVDAFLRIFASSENWLWIGWGSALSIDLLPPKAIRYGRGRGKG